MIYKTKSNAVTFLKTSFSDLSPKIYDKKLQINLYIRAYNYLLSPTIYNKQLFNIFLEFVITRHLLQNMSTVINSYTQFSLVVHTIVYNIHGCAKMLYTIHYTLSSTLFI